MSASSSNTTSSGPNRFRGDAASFSPSQTSPSMIHQQYQQHIYPDYLYGSPSMVPNQYYPYMPYMIHPSSPYAEFNPYGQAYQAYPVQIPQYPGQPYPVIPGGVGANGMNMAAMNMNMNMNMNMGMGMGMGMMNRPKSAHARSKNHHHSSGSVGYNTSNGSKESISNDLSASSSTDNFKQTPSSAKRHSDTKGGLSDEAKQPESNRQNTSVEKQGSKSDVKVSTEQGSKVNEALHFPLYFNSNLDSFINAQKTSIKRRTEKVNEKKERLAKALTNRGVENQSLIINRVDGVKIIDHNESNAIESVENDSYNKYLQSARSSSNAREADKIAFAANGNIDDNKASGKPSNWASILQNTLATAPRKPKAPSKSGGSVSHSKSPSISTQAVSPQQPPSVENADMSTATFPLGVLLLNMMFDKKFSLKSSRTNTPVYKIKKRGLTNTGNICYMNAILQILLYCEPFNKMLKLIETKTVGNLGNKSSTPLLDLVIKFFNEFSSSQRNSNASNKAFAVENFYLSLIANEKFQHLKWGQQEDAEEFLGYLLDGLHEEFVNATKSLTTPQVDGLIQNFQKMHDGNDDYTVHEFKANVKNTMKILKKYAEPANEREDAESDNDGWAEVGSNNRKVSAKRTVEIEPSPITNIFGGQFRSVLQIPKSKESESITLDPYQCIQLDISDPAIGTIEEAFKHMNEPEKIPYKSANKEVIAKKQTFIDQLPNALVIHLKRFSYQQGTRDGSDAGDDSAQPRSNGGIGGIEKLRKKITYSHTLTIPNEVLSPITQKQSANGYHYKLFGVVYHHGIGAEGGHYTCDVLRKSSLHDSQEESNDKKIDNEWIRIDDTQVESIDKNEVLDSGSEESSKNAYILFYQKILI
ncbi:Piso0_001480 [Millerozyma farinosa CBS 7064]|uniref:Ubiquitin carboxyl-terminal hydrolase n=1 Tax=Pichia sorbitophila (strain ATCC MYA-4447 / BCRC 22081 / CBS 7064 / NBRC 10061 / NRRL Y-12695) TaxID=559304 RepID=G8YNA1_PICSO|nr:Piso0_001480 [Millerozyma farinosa CBS 7064]